MLIIVTYSSILMWASRE